MQKRIAANVYLPDAVLLTLGRLLDPPSFLAFARTCHHHLLARQIDPTFFAKLPTLLSLPDEILPLIVADLGPEHKRALDLTCRRILRSHELTPGSDAERSAIRPLRWSTC